MSQASTFLLANAPPMVPFSAVGWVDAGFAELVEVGLPIVTPFVTGKKHNLAMGSFGVVYCGRVGGGGEEGIKLTKRKWDKTQ